jgi:hypothetical protein
MQNQHLQTVSAWKLLTQQFKEPSYRRYAGGSGFAKHRPGVRGFHLESMAPERPLWRFAHPHFCVCVKPLRGFFRRKRKNVANLFTLCGGWLQKLIIAFF